MAPGLAERSLKRRLTPPNGTCPSAPLHPRTLPQNQLPPCSLWQALKILTGYAAPSIYGIHHRPTWLTGLPLSSFPAHCMRSPRASPHPWLHFSSKRTLPGDSSGLPATAGQSSRDSQFYLKERKPGTPPSSLNHKLQGSALAVLHLLDGS